MKTLICTLSLLFAATLGAAADVNTLMPPPKQISPLAGGFAKGRNVVIADATASAELLRVVQETGLTSADKAQAVITVDIIPAERPAHIPAGFPDEAYTLYVGTDTIAITAAETTGVIRAAQTLRQLAQDSGDFIPGVSIADAPAFPVRGFMHDVGRSFLPVDELITQIDLLSRFKVNTFHWHLTDNTGWRMAIDAFPQLTGDKAITRFPGQFYTREDARRLQAFAAERGVTIIPEIDLPGHSAPFKRAMGHDMQSPEGIAELKIILAEVAETFQDAPYIHIGGDEVSFDDSYLVDMIDYVHSLGKRVVIWNRYNRPPKTVDPAIIPCDMTTNWATSGTISPGIPNIDMRYNYNNHFDVFADIVGIYKSSIFNLPSATPDAVGAISATWNDTYTPTPQDIVRQNNIYAAILATTERAWRGGGRQYIEQGGTTIPNEGPEHDEFVDWERRFLYHKATTFAPVAHLIPYVRQTNVHWAVIEPATDGGEGKTHTVTGAGIYLRHIWHPIVKGLFDAPADSTTAYAWTYVYSPVEQDAGALIEFYTYSRSGNAKAPAAGCWDRQGSRIWLNDSELLPPVWQQPDTDIIQDLDTAGLTNENFTARPPLPIHLNKGWNKVFLKLPHRSEKPVNRDKWQFTFVITTPDGLNALEGLSYEPFPQIQ